MPWQRYVADVALEVDPATGRLAYREVVLTVPRQSGKTSLILPVAVHRALGFGARQHIVYTAQTRNDARKKWEDEHQPILEASPLASLVRTRKRTGAEAFVWTNGSIHGINAPTAKAGHGATLDLGFIDEAFARPDDLVEQAFRPAMITRPEPQFWVVSTAGTAESTYLRTKVEAGRRRVENEDGGQACYFEWSAPDDADPLDPATWQGCMPALGHTIDERAIRSELDSMLTEHGADGLNLFRRAYLNQWPDLMGGGWSVIPEAAWRACGQATGRPAAVALCLDASWPDAATGSIGTAGYTADGDLIVQVVDHQPGTKWMVPRVVAIHRNHNLTAVVLDKKGPAAHLIPDLEAAGITVTTPTGEDLARAFGRFIAEVVGDQPKLRHYDQPELDAAVAAAQTRPLGDARTWARRGPVDISPLTAVTGALLGAMERGVEPWAEWV